MKFLVVEGSDSVREAIAIALLPRGIKGLPVANRLAAWEALRADASIQGAIVDVDEVLRVFGTTRRSARQFRIGT